MEKQENDKNLEKKEQRIDLNNFIRVNIKDLNENKSIGLLLISLINDTSKLINEFENMIKEKYNFSNTKNNFNSNITKNDYGIHNYDFKKETSHRLRIIQNFQKIEQIMNEDYLLPNKVLESIFILLIKMLNKIINTIDIKQMIICVSQILLKQISIFISIKKIKEFFKLMHSKNIIENIIKNYLIILDNSNIQGEFSNETEGNNIYSNFNSELILDKELTDKIFSSLNFLFFPMEENYKISIMPGLISRLAKFFFRNFGREINITKVDFSQTSSFKKKYLLSKKVIFIIFKIFNHFFEILLDLKKSKSNDNLFIQNFPKFFEAFDLFFNFIFKLAIDENNSRNNIFFSIDLEINLQNILLLDKNIENRFDNNGNLKIYTNIKNNKTILEEINFVGSLINQLHKCKIEEIINIEISYQEFFYKINHINQKYLFNQFLYEEEYYNEYSNFNDKNKKIDNNIALNFLQNFDHIFKYDDIVSVLNSELKKMNIILNKNELHKLNYLFFKVIGLIHLYEYKLYKQTLDGNLLEEEKLKNNLLSISSKILDTLIDKFFVLKHKKFLQFEELSNFDFKIKNIENDVCLRNIIKHLFQYFNIEKENNCSYVNDFVTSNTHNITGELTTFINCLNFFKFIFLKGKNMQNQLGNILNPNVLYKSILNKNLSYIKNLKTLFSKIDSLNEEIKFLNENIFNSFNLEENNKENDNETEIKEKETTNSENEFINCQSLLKKKFLKAVSSLKENYKDLLKNLVILILLFINIENNNNLNLEYCFLKSFRQQINFIYSNFLEITEIDSDLNINSILIQNEQEIISQFFINIADISKEDRIKKLLIIEDSDKFNKNDAYIKIKQNSSINIFQSDFLKSILMLSFYFLINIQIKKKNFKEQFFSQIELKEILIFTLSNYANNHSHLLKFSSIILIRNLNISNIITQNLNDKSKENLNFDLDNKEIINDNHIKNFILSNFDFVLNSIMKKIIYRSNSNEIVNSNAYKRERKIDMTNLFYSLILLILEIEDNEIRNFYSLELNKFMNKFFFFIDEDIKKKDISNLECSLEILNRITEYQDRILKENYLRFFREMNKIYEKPEFVMDKIFKNDKQSLNHFSEFLKNSTSNFHKANIHRKLILTLCTIFLSNNIILINKFLKIFSNCFLVLFLLPLEKEENTNFSSEDPANVQINHALGPVLFESWSYFIYVVKNIKSINILNHMIYFIRKIIYFYPSFFNENRIFEELIPAMKTCLNDYLFRNYDISITINSVFMILFCLQMLFFMNLKNNKNEDKLYSLYINDKNEKNSDDKVLLGQLKFYTKIKYFDKFKDFNMSIKKFFGNKLETIRLKSIKSFIEMFEKLRISNEKFISLNSDINKNEQYLYEDEYNFFSYVAKESKNIFNLGYSNYDIQNISLYLKIEEGLLEIINENNFNFNTYIETLENLLINQ